MSRRNRLFEQQAVARSWDGSLEAPCAYCGDLCVRVRLTVDHVVPRALGGTSAQQNTVLACWPCNGTKGATPADAFRAWLASPEGRAWWGEGPSRPTISVFSARMGTTSRPAPSQSARVDSRESEDWRTWPRGGLDDYEGE